MAAPHVAGVAALMQAVATTPKTPARDRGAAQEQRARASRRLLGRHAAPASSNAKAASTPPAPPGGGGHDLHQPHGLHDPGQQLRSTARSRSPAGPATRRRRFRSAVTITHTYKGDLKVNLMAPDGSAVQAPQPHRRHRRQRDQDVHRERVERSAQRQVEAARERQRRWRRRQDRYLERHVLIQP